MIKTPIAVFTFNRADHAKRMLASLEQCRRLTECRVHLYCDGPKHDGQLSAVSRSREIVQDWAARHDAVVVERSQNMGLSRSIVSGVTELCERYGKVVVIEDDFILSRDFLNFMLNALERYKNEENVHQVSGYMFPVEHPYRPNTFFLPVTTTWGWATWARAWKHFDWNAGGAIEMLADPKMRYRFDLDGRYACGRMLEERFSGRNDSWGILWWWSVFKRNGLILYPRKSLVWVGGFDGSGTHCKRGRYKQPTLEQFVSEEQIESYQFPKMICADAEAYFRVKQSLGDSKWAYLLDSIPSVTSRLIRNIINFTLRRGPKC